MTYPTAFAPGPAAISAVSGCPLVPRAEAAMTARAFTWRTLADWGLADLADDAQLIVTELLANALRHAWPGAAQDDPQRLGLWLVRQAGALMCAVTDPSQQAPALQQPGSAGESGRGLQVIHALSHYWGWSPLDEQGKAVWAILLSG